ncbi:right-handed parallel beta-helix repeat-containing protein [candidate division KSB1 bacterium]|nr:right-handed parallel beta-helix repeat-containing protein [candidate division KSB1 bacterium]
MKSLPFFFLIYIGLIGPLFPATYYVSTSGDDTHVGSFSQPWASPGYGSKQMSGGDTLIILGGTYTLSVFWDDMITPPSGTTDQWTVIQGETGNRPVLAGRDNLFSAIELSDKSNLIIANLEITSDNGAYFREGISASGYCEGIVLQNLYIHHMDEFGIDFQDVQDLIVEDCNIQYCGFGAIGGPEGTAGGWRDATISGCNLSYSGHYYQGVIAPGVGPYDRPDGLGLEPSDGPLDILSCRAEHNRGDGLDSKIKNTTIRNCIVANNHCDGVKLWGDGSSVSNSLIYGTGDGDPTDSPWAALVIDNVDDPGATFNIVNTTIHQDPRKHGYILYSQYDSSAPITIHMQNTIIAGGSGSAYFGPSVTLNLDHCLIHRENETVQVEANGQQYTAQDLENGLLGPGNLSADPLFQIPAWGTEGNYRLQSGSPAIDAGTSEHALIDTDLDSNPRLSGPEVDIGCYEFQAPTGVEKKSTAIQAFPLIFHTDRNLLEIKSDYPGRLSVYNVLGQSVLNRQVEGNTAVSICLPSGIYIAVLDAPEQRTIQRFTVIR